MANKLDLKIEFPSDAELKKMFDAVPRLQRYNVSDKAVNAAARIVARRAKQLAPRQTAQQRKKRSAKQAKEANWNIPLYQTIAVVVRKYAINAAGIVGPKWPDGNKAYFNTGPGGNKGHHWGYEGKEYATKSGRIHIAGPAKWRAQIRNWIVKAFDETKTQQLEEIKKSLKKSMKELWGG